MDSDKSDFNYCLNTLLKLRDLVNDTKYAEEIQRNIAECQNGRIKPKQLNRLKAALLDLENKVSLNQPRSRNESTDTNPSINKEIYGIKITSVVSLNHQTFEDEPALKRQKLDESYLSEYKFSNELRPWLKQNEFYKVNKVKVMLKTKCLYDMFKCMKSDCEFHSNDSKEFIKHLKNHLRKERERIRNFLRCSYCNFDVDKIHDLMAHIANTHSFDIYGCSYCFYRSATKISAKFHTRHYHGDKVKKILYFKIPHNSQKFDYKGQYYRAKISLRKFIQPLGIYGKRYYIKDDFLKELKEKYASIHSIQCRKCGDKIQITQFHSHLEACHKIYDFHCVHCEYGSHKSRDVKLHLVDKHADKIPLFCQRIKIKDSDSSSIDCLPLIQLSTDI